MMDEAAPARREHPRDFTDIGLDDLRLEMHHRIPAVHERGAAAVDGSEAGAVRPHDDELSLARGTRAYEFDALGIDVDGDDPAGQRCQPGGVASVAAGEINNRAEIRILDPRPDEMYPLPADDPLGGVEINRRR